MIHKRDIAMGEDYEDIESMEDVIEIDTPALTSSSRKLEIRRAIEDRLAEKRMIEELELW
jgi:hypothetical protein